MFKNAHVKMFGFVTKVIIFFRCYYTALHWPAWRLTEKVKPHQAKEIF